MYYYCKNELAEIDWILLRNILSYKICQTINFNFVDVASKHAFLVYDWFRIFIYQHKWIHQFGLVNFTSTDGSGLPSNNTLNNCYSKLVSRTAIELFKSLLFFLEIQELVLNYLKVCLFFIYLSPDVISIIITNPLITFVSCWTHCTCRMPYHFPISSRNCITYLFYYQIKI